MNEPFWFAQGVSDCHRVAAAMRPAEPRELTDEELRAVQQELTRVENTLDRVVTAMQRRPAAPNGRKSCACRGNSCSCAKGVRTASREEVMLGPDVCAGLSVEECRARVNAILDDHQARMRAEARQRNYG